MDRLWWKDTYSCIMSTQHNRLADSGHEIGALPVSAVAYSALYLQEREVKCLFNSHSF